MKTIVYFENGEIDIVKHLEGGSGTSSRSKGLSE